MIGGGCGVGGTFGDGDSVAHQEFIPMEGCSELFNQFVKFVLNRRENERPTMKQVTVVYLLRFWSMSGS